MASQSPNSWSGQHSRAALRVRNPGGGKWAGRPAAVGLLAFTVLFATSIACITIVWRASVETHAEQYRGDLERLACVAGSQINLAEHDAIRNPGQQNGEQYLRVADPLKRMLARAAGVRYFYTAIEHEGAIAFVLDASDPGDSDGDGREDQAKILEVYAEPDPGLLECFRSRRVTSSAKPYADDWGRFMSAWAPLLDADGHIHGVLGLDVTAERYDEDLAHMNEARNLALMPAVLLSLAAGFLTFFLRRAERRAAVDRDRALDSVAEQARVLAVSNEQLASARLAAEASCRAKSEFLANMSHEIRTPMTAILGFADLLAQGGDSSEEAVATIRRNGEHLLSILNDILDLSKIEAGRMTVERLHVDLLQLCGEVAALGRVRAEQHGVELTVEAATRLPRSVTCDPLRLRQILMNLTGNALKFTECGWVRIVISADEASRRIAIEVRDSGIGMTQEQIAQLFQPFTQADGSMSRRFGGTGLGLTISRRLANMLGGDIVVSSELGKGSTFRLELPIESNEPIVWVVSDHAAPLPASARSNNAATIRLDGVKVLLADDGKDNQRLISIHLKRAGAVVEVVDNGAKVLERLCDGEHLRQDAAFDVLFLDMQMPELDGYGTARRLRELGSTLPIVALTAHAMSGDRAKCLAAGCDDYATKPVDRDALLSAARRWAGARSTARS